MPSPTGIHGIVLIAKDFERQVAFYRDTMKLHLLSRSHDAAFFQVGSQILGVFSRTHHAQGTARLGGATHGISHIEFSVAASEVDGLTQQLSDAAALAYKNNFEDADGNLFHFVVEE